MGTAAVKQKENRMGSESYVTMTPYLTEQFLNSLKAGGHQKQTIRTYRHSLDELYDFLPSGKEIRTDTLKEWKEHLKKCGYSDSTVNIRLTAANGFLRYCGKMDLGVSYERIVSDEAMPEMTREEYLTFLSKVREMGSEKYYLLIKVFASVDISIGELEYLTRKACREGTVCLPDGRRSAVPSCLKEELLRYAEQSEIAEGPIFVTRSGTVLDRSNIANSIRRLALRAGMDPEKCCPSALHRVYLATQRELMSRLMPLYMQSYENLLNTEQMVVAWNR